MDSLRILHNRNTECEKCIFNFMKGINTDKKMQFVAACHLTKSILPHADARNGKLRWFTMKHERDIHLWHCQLTNINAY